MNRRIVAILNYHSSKGILNVSHFLEASTRRGKVLPRDWKNTSSRFRSLIVYDDGSCQLCGMSSTSMVRRLEESCW